jgi:pyruvate dehydrogenase E1 component
MFGFQRIGDLIWAACDNRARGFLMGGTAGRTTLAGEGLQHQDGHSHLNAIAFPTVRPYDPAFGYELTVIVLDGMRRMFHENEEALYYITIGNEPYRMPAMPEGVEEGIVRGIYKLSSVQLKDPRGHVQLFGSGAILREVLRAQALLAERYRVASDVWSLTSYTLLRRDCQAAERWNLLHPDQPWKTSYFEQTIAGHAGPFIAASDYVRAVPEQLDPWVPGGLTVLGTDGFGRSDGREALRRHFEVDAEHVAVAALHRLSEEGAFAAAEVAAAIHDLGIDPEKPAPWTV